MHANGPAPYPNSRQPQAPVSVVVPCYRCAGTIAEAVQSALSQTLAPAEIVLVDDCSGDDTLHTLQALAAAQPAGTIRVIALPENGGASRARNAGWEQARQPYVAFLDADDTWSPRKLELQTAVLRADPKIALAAHRMVVRDRASALPSVREPVRAAPIGRFRLLLNNPFPTASVVLRRDLPFRFDERFRRVEDFLLWAQIVLSGHHCVKLNQTLASWHKPTYGAGGLSGDLDAMHAAARQVREELLRQGLMSRAEGVIAHASGAVRRARRRLLLRLRTAAAAHGNTA